MGTSLATAPAVVGAINLGVEPTITHMADGVRITGCDFVSNASPLSTAIGANWATVSGFAVAPYSLGSNTLSDMSRTYGEFMFERLAVAYVPSVGTSANGQVAIFRKTTRSSPGLDPNGSNFFPYVLNQRTGVVGPVWQPLTIEFPQSKRWLSTLPLDGTDIDEEADGEVFMCTNNTAQSGIAPSIGMFKIFYMVRFRQMERNSRSSLIPLANQIYTPISLGVNTTTAVVGDPWSPNVVGVDQTGANATLPGGTIIGDIYKFIVDVSKSFFGSTSPTNTLSILLVGQRYNINFTGYMTFYALYTPNGWQMYMTYNNAVTQTDGLQYGVIQTANTVVLRGLVSLVGNITTRVNQTL